jgi:hypothetical protein
VRLVGAHIGGDLSCKSQHKGHSLTRTFDGASEANGPASMRARADEVGLIESGLVSCGESGLLGELVEGVLVVAGGGAQGAGGGWVGIGELGQAGLE